MGGIHERKKCTFNLYDSQFSIFTPIRVLLFALKINLEVNQQLVSGKQPYFKVLSEISRETVNITYLRNLYESVKIQISYL